MANLLHLTSEQWFHEIAEDMQFKYMCCLLGGPPLLAKLRSLGDKENIPFWLYRYAEEKAEAVQKEKNAEDRPSASAAQPLNSSSLRVSAFLNGPCEDFRISDLYVCGESVEGGGTCKIRLDSRKDRID